MNPTELRQAVPEDVEKHMRDKGVWPKGLCWFDEKALGVGFDKYLPCWFILAPNSSWEPALSSHAAALIGWALEGAIESKFGGAQCAKLDNADSHQFGDAYCIMDSGGHILGEGIPKVAALVAAYRRSIA